MIDNNQNINNNFQNGLIQNEINPNHPIPNGQIQNDIEWIWNNMNIQDQNEIINANIQLAQEEANRDANAPPIIENNNLDDNNRPRFFGAFMNLPNL